MTLASVRDWLKTKISGLESCTIGKLDTSKNQAVCVYNRPSANNKIAVGGLHNTSSANKKICILVHWGTNCNIAELKAQEVYNLLYGKRAVIGNSDCFFSMEHDEPVGLGTDDNGIYEYTIDLTITFKRG